MLWKPDGNVLDSHGEEGLAAGGLGDLAEDFVTLVFAGADVGGDGVDDGVGALAFFDGVGLEGAGVVVVAVGDEDEGTTDGEGIAEREHLIATGFVERVKERGTAAGTKLADALVEEVDVVGEALGEVGLDVEAFDEGAIVEVEDLEEELDGGVLLKLEALADGAGGVEHDADAQRQIACEGEVADADGRAVIVEQAEVVLLEVGDEVAFFIGDGEDEIDLVGLYADGGDSSAPGRAAV